MYQPGKFMKSGSANDTIDGQPSDATTYVIDFNSPTPRWQQTASMAFGRTHHNLTLLPDGNVLATGGTLIKDGSNSSPGVLEAEMWSPLTQTWTTMARGTIERKYHSTGLLLPDGRVLVAGTGRNSNGLIDHEELRAVFATILVQRSAPPHYLRPCYRAVWKQLLYGNTRRCQCQFGRADAPCSGDSHD